MTSITRRLGAVAAIVSAATLLSGCPTQPPLPPEPTGTVVPAAPNGLAIERVGAATGVVHLRWIPIPVAEAYEFRFRAQGVDQGHVQVVAGPASSASFHSASLTAWMTFDVFVRIRVGGVWSHLSWPYAVTVCEFPHLAC